MTTITEDLDLPDGTDPASVYVFLQLWGAGAAVTGFEQATMKSIAGIAKTTGTPWSITNVVGNSAIDAPVGTVYKLTRTWPGLRDPLVDYITVPATGGPYRVDQVLTDPPAAVTSSALSTHAIDAALHSGGQRLGIAHLATNFTTASTSYVDITGASVTFTVPPTGKFVAEAWLPILVEEATRSGDIRMVYGAVPSLICADTVRAAAANQAMSFHLRAPIPAPIWTPAPSSVQTIKLQAKTSIATSDVSVFVDFAGLQNVAYLEVYSA